jgi:oligopeptide/dipeptide ABC transporter ATP-binding protein
VIKVASPLLSVEDLHVEITTRRGVIKAVDGISFEVEEGEAVGLVGESGCGKSMTLRAILGLLPRGGRISGGRVLFRGTDLCTLDKEALRDIRGRSVSMIFQEPMTALNPVMPVGEQIAEGPVAHLGVTRRVGRRRALELMRQVGIPDPDRRFGSYPHELSGGLRQRVMIAIALASGPELILCDEPTTALDVTIQDQILKLLLDLQAARDIGLIFVTHDLAVVSQMCTQVAVMYAAQAVETGTVASVFAEPKHPYTLGLLRAVPDFDNVKGTLASIPGIPPDLAAPPDGCRFRARCELAEDDCATGAFPLAALDGGRASSCIHWPKIRRVSDNPVMGRTDDLRTSQES